MRGSSKDFFFVKWKTNRGRKNISGQFGFLWDFLILLEKKGTCYAYVSCTCLGYSIDLGTQSLITV